MRGESKAQELHDALKKKATRQHEPSILVRQMCADRTSQRSCSNTFLILKGELSPPVPWNILLCNPYWRSELPCSLIQCHLSPLTPRRKVHLGLCHLLEQRAAVQWLVCRPHVVSTGLQLLCDQQGFRASVGLLRVDCHTNVGLRGCAKTLLKRQLEHSRRLAVRVYSGPSWGPPVKEGSYLPHETFWPGKQSPGNTSARDHNVI